LKWSTSARTSATGSPLTSDCARSSSTRVRSAERFSIPVSGSTKERLRNSRSELISAVESSAIETISAAGAITSGGSWRTAPTSTPRATASSSARARATPAAIPRTEKREARVTTGIASQERVAIFGPPLRATLIAMIPSDPAQAAKRPISGRRRRGVTRSAIANRATAAQSGAIVHQPIQGPQASSATARTAKARRRTGAIRRSMSSIRSRSRPSPISQEPSVAANSSTEWASAY
jgi:hypothetical protein